MDLTAPLLLNTHIVMEVNESFLPVHSRKIKFSFYWSRQNYWILCLAGFMEAFCCVVWLKVKATCQKSPEATSTCGIIIQSEHGTTKKIKSLTQSCHRGMFSVHEGSSLYEEFFCKLYTVKVFFFFWLPQNSPPPSIYSSTSITKGAMKSAAVLIKDHTFRYATIDSRLKLV